jgi:hypothetical protein
MTQMKIIVEKHSEGYVAYPLGLKGVVDNTPIPDGGAAPTGSVDVKIKVLAKSPEYATSEMSSLIDESIASMEEGS